MVELEAFVRLGAFLAVFAAVACWELARPRRQGVPRRPRRWAGNLGLLAVDVIALRLLAPGAAIAVAMVAQAGGWGALNVVPMPAVLAAIVAVLLLDLAVYFQHVIFHAVPALWRLHRVHHSDLDFDLTTGIRFHPAEVLVSLAVKCAAIVAIGAPPAAVLCFEVLLNAAALFNHANAAVPARIERWLRWLLVTPDLHRVHHSVQYDESSSNFGFSVPWWDRLFGTYRDEPRTGHAAMTIGVDAFRTLEDSRLERLLLQPLQDTPGQYPITRRAAAG